MGIFDKLFGTHSERELKRIQPLVDATLYCSQPAEELRSVPSFLP